MKKGWFLWMLIVNVCISVKGQTTGGELIIPANTEKIEAKAFANNSEMTRIVLPEGLKEIGDSAFYRCTYLEEIVFPESLETIGEGAFEGCFSLENIELKEGTKVIGKRAFASCRLLADVKLPESLYSIGDSAFFYCDLSLKSIRLPYGLKELGSNAFNHCDELTAIEIPAGITEIKEAVFYGCKNLETVKLGNVASIQAKAFMNCSSLKSIKIPTGLKVLSDEAFMNCSSLKSIKIPTGLKVLGDEAFSGSGIEKVSLPENMTSFGNGTFSNCKSLLVANLKRGPKKIGVGLFKGCKQMEAVSIPSGITIIQKEAFEDCSSLKNINIPDDVEEIDSAAFRSCAGASISFGSKSKLQIIGDKAFVYCFRGNMVLPESVKKIGAFAFEDSDVKNVPKNLETLGRCAFAGSRIEEIVLPDNLTVIPEEAFSYCKKATAIVFPENLKSIGYRTFADCTSLTDFDLPDALEEIGGYAFGNCSSLTKLYIPKSVRKISDVAFRDCKLKQVIVAEGNPHSFYEQFVNITPTFFVSSSVTSETFRMSYVHRYTDFYLNSKIPPAIVKDIRDAMLVILKETKVYVPEGSGEAYLADPYWRYFSIIDGQRPVGIQDNKIGPVEKTEEYDMLGRKQRGILPGVSIIKTKDGKTKKVFKKAGK